MSRYAQPRVLLNWNKNDHLRILKMLAWVVYDREHVRNAGVLAGRVDALCESVMRTILAEEGMTLQTIQEQTLAEQGASITATKLLQRADKTDRYDEFNEFVAKVEEVYDLHRQQRTTNNEPTKRDGVLTRYIALVLCSFVPLFR